MWWSEPGAHAWRRAARRAADPCGVRRRRRALVGVTGALLALSAGIGGCGFRLRQPPRLAFPSLALTGFEPRSPLAAELRRRIAGQVEIVDVPARAAVVLQVLVDRRERSVVASTAAAQVRELQLRVLFDFRVHDAAGRELLPRAQLLLRRDMSYSEAAALAKEQEEAELFGEMQSDIVAQVLRRLATVRLPPT